MALGSEVYDTIDVILSEKTCNQFIVTYIAFDESIVRHAFDITEILKVSRICQGVKIDYPVIRIFVHQKPHEVTSYESGTAGDQYIPHNFILFTALARESRQCGISMPKVSFTFVLSRTEQAGRAAGDG